MKAELLDGAIVSNHKKAVGAMPESQTLVLP